MFQNQTLQVKHLSTLTVHKVGQGVPFIKLGEPILFLYKECTVKLDNLSHALKDLQPSPKAGILSNVFNSIKAA